MSVYRVYWSSQPSACDCDDCKQLKLSVHAKDFGPEEMSEALNYCAELRTDKSNSFITLVAEDPNCVSNGVATPSPYYDWEKRRGGRK